jgi:hypothetical protein
MNVAYSTQRILYDVARRRGLVPEGDDANMDPEAAYQMLGFMDDRLREAWDLYDFIETTFCEQRAFAPDYDVTACYPLNSIVWDPCTQQYYQALVMTTGAPLSNTAIWAPNPNVSPRYIPWQAPGKTPIGAAFGAWNKNPYEQEHKIRQQFLISARGLEFTATSNCTFVWLVFRIPYPGIGRSQWVPTTTYNTGDATIDGTDTYISSIDSNVGHQPSLTPASWTMFRIPYPMTRFVTQAAFADTLVVDGQNEKAPDQLTQAFGYLSEAFDQQQLQQGQRDNWQGYFR